MFNKLFADRLVVAPCAEAPIEPVIDVPEPKVSGENCPVVVVPIVFAAPVLRMLMPNCSSLVRSTSAKVTFSMICLSRLGTTVSESTMFLE